MLCRVPGHQRGARRAAPVNGKEQGHPAQITADGQRHGGLIRGHQQEHSGEQRYGGGTEAVPPARDPRHSLGTGPGEPGRGQRQ